MCLLKKGSRLGVRRNLKNHLALQTLVCLLVGATCWLLFREAERFPEALGPLCWTFIGLSCWNFYSWRVVSGTLFDPYSIFLTAATLFSGGQLLLYPLGFLPRGIVGGALPENAVLRAAVIVVVGMAAMHLGALACMYAERLRVRGGIRGVTDYGKRRRGLALAGFLLFVVSVHPWFAGMRADLSTSWQYGYGLRVDDGARRATAALGQMLGAFFPVSLVYLFAGLYRTRSARYFIWGAAAGVEAVCFFIGGRGMVMLAISLAWMSERLVGRIPRAALYLGSLGLLAVFALVSGTRATSGADRASLEAMSELARSVESPIISAVAEMGDTIRTIGYSTLLVPDVRPFDVGTSYAYAAVAIVPNLFWDTHPAMSHGYLADWLMLEVDPSVARRGGGLGYSFLAEAYVNFGLGGVAMIALVVGALAARLSLWVDERPDAGRVALVGSILSFALLFARGESASLVRSLFWYAAFPYALARLLIGAGMGRSRRSAGDTVSGSALTKARTFSERRASGQGWA